MCSRIKIIVSSLSLNVATGADLNASFSTDLKTTIYTLITHLFIYILGAQFEQPVFLLYKEKLKFAAFQFATFDYIFTALTSIIGFRMQSSSNGS